MSILNFKGGEPSQNGETNLINECIKRMKLKKGVAIEFGAPTKQYCSNIYHLIAKGWDCRYYDLDPQEAGIEKKRITTDNINELPECSIASIDTDGPCFELWGAWQQNPAIVIIEINSSLPPTEDFYSPEKGCNFSLMNKLAESKGYFLLCHTGNMVFCLNKYKELFPDRSESFDTSWL